LKAAQVSAPRVARGGKAVARVSVKGANATAPFAKTAGKLVVENHREIAVGVAAAAAAVATAPVTAPVAAAAAATATAAGVVAAVGRAISNAKVGDDNGKATSRKSDSAA
jgi:hypothetical protein